MRGRLAFGLPPSVGIGLTTPLVDAYRQRYPAVSLQLVEDLSGAVQEQLVSGRLDLGVLYEGATSASLEVERLFSETLWLLAPLEADLESTVRFADLAHFALILPGRRNGLRAIIQQYAFRENVVLEVGVEVDSLRAQIELAERGLGATLLPETALSAAAGRRLRFARVVDPEIQRHLVLARPRDVPPTRPVLAMMELLRARCPELLRLPASTERRPR